MDPLTESEFSSTMNQYLIIYLIMGTLIMISSFIQVCSNHSSFIKVWILNIVPFLQHYIPNEYEKNMLTNFEIYKKNYVL